MTTTEEKAEFDHVESLLAWYASGTLAPDETQRVEKALAAVPEFRRRFDLILEERSAVAALNEGLGAPSPRVLEKLFARIESADLEAPKKQSFVLRNWLAERLAVWQRHSLALAGMAAALVAIIEAGLLATMLLRTPQKGATYETASVTRKAAEQDGAFLLIAIAPEATAAQILRFLENHKASIVDGPAPGGMFRIKVSENALTADELSATAASMRKESTVVRFVAPTK